MPLTHLSYPSDLNTAGFDLGWFPTGVQIDNGTGFYSPLLFTKTKHKLLFDWIWKKWISGDSWFSHGLRSSCNWIWPQNTCFSFTDLHCGDLLRNCLENFQFLMHPCDNVQLEILTILDCMNDCQNQSSILLPKAGSDRYVGNSNNSVSIQWYFPSIVFQQFVSWGPTETLAAPFILYS